MVKNFHCVKKNKRQAQAVWKNSMESKRLRKSSPLHLGLVLNTVYNAQQVLDKCLLILFFKVL